jgi:hypothetical protein
MQTEPFAARSCTSQAHTPACISLNIAIEKCILTVSEGSILKTKKKKKELVNRNFQSIKADLCTWKLQITLQISL